VLAVSWDTIRLFLHVLAATIWVGGQIVLAALVPILRRAGSPLPCTSGPEPQGAVRSSARSPASAHWPRCSSACSWPA
jgi:hypothetical protein